MRLLDSLTVHHAQHDKRVEIYQGDLTELTPEQATDVLIVSAFPGDYEQTPGSLIGALGSKGISVAALAERKQPDLREEYSCWVSEEIRAADPGIRFRRLLCFEPSDHENGPAERVGDIFRALAPVVGSRPPMTRVAMPLVACGDRSASVESMLGPLVDAAVHWMEIGSPIQRLRIVELLPERAERMRAIFADLKRHYLGRHLDQPRVPRPYDVFLSYSQENKGDADFVWETLKALRPGIRVFMDRLSLHVGRPWQPHIVAAVRGAHRVVPLYTPQYLRSKACQEEFKIAYTLRESEDETLLFPMYVREANLDRRMTELQYRLCVEGSRELMRAACEELLHGLPRASA